MVGIGARWSVAYLFCCTYSQIISICIITFLVNNGVQRGGGPLVRALWEVGRP